ncbi:virulence factor family protein [Neorhizobium alkalisoli]|uniref:Type IV secretory pathway VirJ component n=1 Tax=Neorhizobium alkalisoli TaxID=528178 RepID=A0A561R3A9_9HYPH|nr:AcvB/VirJ family lysyl-phosphatidylglycerol hydrolase [Neorhizobium alkalisoli]TWF57108.1 type IV secretory pathway VirJ component [Neorhizobium alkalisoli]
MKLLPIIVGCLTIASFVANADCETYSELASLPTSLIAYPDENASGIVILLSDEDGWTDDEEDMSDALVAEGAVVVGVDLPDYYASLSAEERDCLYLVSDIEEISRRIHRDRNMPIYHQPLVAGIGAGGALALAIAAQTPPSTIAGTLAINPKADIALQKILCTPAKKTPVEGGMAYGLTDGPLPNPVRVVFGPQADEAGRAHVGELRAAHADIETADAATDPGTAVTAPELLLRDLVVMLRHQRDASTPLDLPIIPLDTVAAHDTMAIIYSGDGGWRDIDRKLAAYLVEDGIPVVGVDALRYFWTEKGPEATAADLSRIIDTYRKRYRVGHVVLIGYSFGANILPATYRALPEADRKMVSLISLLALSHQADFEIAVTGWLGYAGAGKHGDPVEDLKAIEPFKIQCVYGIKEEDTACPDVQAIAGAQVLARNGGHHFDGDYKAIERLIVERLKTLVAVN